METVFSIAVIGMGEDSVADIKNGETWEFKLDYVTFDEQRIERISVYELFFVI